VPKVVFKPKTPRKPLAYEPSWAALEELFSSPWFWRLWVIQEVAVSSSSTLIWGDGQIHWNLVGEACNWLKANYPLSRRTHIFGAYNAAYIYNLEMQARKGKLHPFLNVMVSTWLFNSTDPRDRVFALLGLQNSDSDPDDGALFLEPDYSLTTSQVYLALARRVLEGEKTLRLFGAVQHDPAKPLSTPSWVPQWLTWTMEPLVPIDYVTNQMSRPAQDSFAVLTSDPELLVIRGLKIDTVTSSTKIIPWESLASNYNHKIENCNWIGEVDKLLAVESYQLTRTRLKSLCWTLTAGRGHDVWSTRDNHWEASQALWLEAMKHSKSGHWENIGTCPTESPEEDFIHCGLHQFLGSATYGRRIFVTRNGTIGLGPASLQKGDLVAVLFGGLTPFVLRQRDDHYLLVGECYVHGQMEGEAIDEWEEGSREAENFNLR
jgi:hypothetical protein